MTFPSASFTDSSPRTLRSCSNEMHFVSDRDIFYYLTVQPNRILAPEANITRFLGDILR